MSWKPAPKNARLAMALTAKDRALIDKASRTLELPASVWARALVLKEAARVVGEAEAAK